MLRLFKKIFLIYEGEREKYPESYLGELNYQCGQILPFGALICIFAFLPYIEFDQKIHPELPYLIYFRLGLSVVGLFTFLMFYILPRSFRVALGTLIVGYLVVSTGIATGLTRADSVYVGGFLFVLMVVPLMPLPKSIGWGILLTAMACFFAVAWQLGIEVDNPRARYSLNDLLTTPVVAAVIIFTLDKIRFSSWKKSRQIEDQQKQLKDDNEKIDSLLLNILPQAVANELKSRGTARPSYYESATVVFTDFVGFTKIAEELTPQELVDELDRCFSHFDQIMTKHHLEKLKTIGDSYMYAGGVPERNTSHPVDAVLAAMEMQNYMRELERSKQAKGVLYWHMRLGINTGPLMAGIVGEKKFVYDVFGDSVNTASRMESSGDPDQINISHDTNELIKDFFDTVSRGKIKAKNKGYIEMFFVKGIHPELSINGLGREPNHEFRHKLEEAFGIRGSISSIT